MTSDAHARDTNTASSDPAHLNHWVDCVNSVFCSLRKFECAKVEGRSEKTWKKVLKIILRKTSEM